MRRLGIILALVCAASTPVAAQITPTYVFAPGQVISSQQTNANFALLQNALNRGGGTMTGTLTTRALLPSTSAQYDVGTNEFRYRNAYFSGDIDLSAGSTFRVSGVPVMVPEGGSTGQTLVKASGANYDFTWGTGNQVMISDTPPVTAAAGDLWWNSEVGSLFIYYTDTNSSQWVDAVSIGGLGGATAVTSVSGTGTVNGLTLTGTVTSSGSLTLGGALTNVRLDTTGGAQQVTGTLPLANGGTGATTAAAARTALGSTTIGDSVFTLSNTSVSRFIRLNSNNTISTLTATDFRAAIGAGTGNGTITSVSASGSVNGINITSSTVAGSTTITLGGALSNISLASQVIGTLPLANGGTGATTAATARTSLGASTAGNALFTLANGSTVRFIRINGDNTVDALSASDFRTAIGAGTGSGTVTSVSGGGSVNGLTISGTVTTTGTLTLSGTLTGVNLGSQVTGTLTVANGGTGATSAASARANLGGTTVGQNVFILPNPSAVTFPRFNADNTVDALTASTFRAAIGAGVGDGTVTSVSGTGTVNGLTLTGTVTSSGDLTLGGTLSNVSLSTQVTGTLPVNNGGTNATTASAARTNLGLVINTDVQAYSGVLATVATATYTTAGQFLRATGSTVGLSTLVLPNSATANAVPYATSTNTLGESASFTFNGTTLSAPTVSASTGTFTTTLTMAATAKLYLDGGNDTYIHESSANTVQLVTGGVVAATFTAGTLVAENGMVQTSDMRKKHDIRPLALDNARAFLMAIRPVTYVLNGESTVRMGVLAQEVVAAAHGQSLQGILTTFPDGSYGVNYAGLVPALLATVQAQDADIATLRHELAELRVQLGRKE